MGFVNRRTALRLASRRRWGESSALALPGPARTRGRQRGQRDRDQDADYELRDHALNEGIHGDLRTRVRGLPTQQVLYGHAGTARPAGQRDAAARERPTERPGVMSLPGLPGGTCHQRLRRTIRHGSPGPAIRQTHINETSECRLPDASTRQQLSLRGQFAIAWLGSAGPHNGQRAVAPRTGQHLNHQVGDERGVRLAHLGAVFPAAGTSARSMPNRTARTYPAARTGGAARNFEAN